MDQGIATVIGSVSASLVVGTTTIVGIIFSLRHNEKVERKKAAQEKIFSSLEEVARKLAEIHSDIVSLNTRVTQRCGGEKSVNVDINREYLPIFAKINAIIIIADLYLPETLAQEAEQFLTIFKTLLEHLSAWLRASVASSPNVIEVGAQVQHLFEKEYLVRYSSLHNQFRALSKEILTSKKYHTRF